MAERQNILARESSLAHLKPTGVFVILPVLNEIENIAQLLQNLRKHLEPEKYLICFIDDGSTDGTVEFIEEEQRKGAADIHLIRRTKVGRGSQRGGALRDGLAWGLSKTRFGIFVEMDGDLSHRPEELPTGIRLVQENACDVAIASKYVPGSQVTRRSFGRRAVSQLSSIAVSLLISRRLKDYSNGFRFYTREAAQLVSDHRIRYSSPIYLTEVLALWVRRGLRVIEFTTIYVGRDEGISKLRLIDLAKASLAVFEIAMRYHVVGFSRTGQEHGKENRSEPEKVAPAPVEKDHAHPIIEGRIQEYTIKAFAVLLALFAMLIGFSSDRYIAIDELGLLNPVYTYLHFGKMTYPIHYQFDTMTIHPPVHYIQLAWLMKIGLNAYYAEAVPIVVMTLLALYMIQRGKFPSGVKLGLMFGFFSSSMFLFQSWNILYSVRPDLTLSIAWFTGLVTLESARLDQWNARKLFLGSFLLTYASGMHYFAVVAFTGLVVYAIWVFRALPFPEAKVRLLSMIGGGCVFGVPYVVLFVIPNWAGIHWITSQVQGDKNLVDAIARHFASYDYWAATIRMGVFQTPLSANAVLPVLKLHIPAIVASFVPLVILRSTRGIALASLPLPLFVFIFSQGKSAGYYVPEFALYMSASTIVAVRLMQWLSKKTRWEGMCKLVTPAAALLLGFVVVADNQAVRATTLIGKVRAHEVDLARSVGRAILGPNALVGGRIGAWYSSGASHWYDVASDLLWRKDLSVDPREYFSHFDAIAEYYHMSNVTLNNINHTLSTWYAESTLTLRGFYFAAGGQNLSYVLLCRPGHSRVVGYGYKDEQLYRFEETPYGEYLFVSVGSHYDTLLQHTNDDKFFSNIILLPSAHETKTQMGIMTFVARRSEVNTAVLSLEGKGRLLDTIPLEKTIVDPRELLVKLEQEDNPIRFYKTLAEAVQGSRLRRRE